MKHLKIGLLILLIFLVCLITTWLIIKKYYVTEMVHSRIEQSINEQIENEFQITYDQLKVNWFSSRVQLNGFHLLWFNQTDTVGYIKGDIQVNVKGWRNLFFNKQKSIKNIALKKADLYYAADHPLIMKSKDSNSVQELKIANASAIGKLLFANKHKEQSGQLDTEFDFTAALNYNSTDSFSVGHLVSQATNFELSQVHYYFLDGFYQLKIDEVAFSKFDDIVLKQVIVNPIHSRMAFAIKKKVASNFTSVSIDSIQLLEFDSQVNEQIIIDQIIFYQPSVDVFKDKNYPDGLKFKAIFVDLLREIEMPVYIRSIALKNMFIKYTELANNAPEAGDLFFSNAYATISNLTNVEDSLQQSSQMLIDAKGEFYGEGEVNASISYELLPGPGHFGIKGSLSPMDIGKANAILSKLLPVKIKKGQVDKLHFSFSGTRLHSVGEMWFEYSDLHLELLESNFLNGSFTRNVATSVGNMMLRNSNPASNGTFKVGAIDQDRDTTKSMFNYWWLSLQSGFLSTLGVKPEKKLINYKSGEKATFFDKIGLGEQ